MPAPIKPSAGDARAASRLPLVLAPISTLARVYGKAVFQMSPNDFDTYIQERSDIQRKINV